MSTDDAAARERIRTSLDESLLVEAAAGTGKTTELVARLVAVLGQGRARVGGVVAVTFTRKAAGELKLRLRHELDRARSTAASPSIRRNLEDAVAQLEEARVGTIHSFCGELLRERPVEAGVDPDFAELAEDEAPRLYHRVFATWIQEKMETLPPGLRRALSRLALESSFVDPASPLDRLRDAGWQLVDWRDFPAPWRREPFDRDAEVDAQVDEVFRLARMSARCGNRRDYLRRALEPVELLASSIERSEAVGRRDYDSLEARLVDLRRGFKDLRKGWGKFADGLERDDVVAARDHLLRGLDELQARANADLAALLHGELKEVVERYEAAKRLTGGLDFMDLLLRSRDLLRENAEVRRHLQSRFTHLFVDEFQDTDPLQTEILLLLAADDPEETDWRHVRPVAGKLFAVGDPKQSIYRFRRADVLLYQEVKRSLVSRHVGLVRLTRSYRGTRPLQAAINAAFAPEMQEDPVRGQAEYLPLVHVREAVETQPTVVVLPPPRPYSQYGRITKYRVEECLPETVSAFVAWLLDASGWTVEAGDEPGRRVPVAPHHVCILFRRFVSWGRDVTREYLRSLEARGVPHVLVGQRSFHQREEVETLRAALTAVEWPDDELAVFATLRGSLFALSDDVLLRFKEEVGKLHPFRPVPEVTDDDFAAVWEALDCLAGLHRRRHQRAIVETLQELLEFTRAHAGFALRPAGHQVLANVERVLDLARNSEIQGQLSLRGFVEELNSQAQRPHSAPAPVVEEGTEGVRVMTVHNAKGLEFPVVILADMTARLAAGQPDKVVDPRRGLCALRILGWTPWELLDASSEESQRDAAEGVRVAYVAATRARDLLVVPAVGDEPMAGWIAPVNKAVYPDSQGWRRSRPAPGCPPFGPTSVAERPPDFDGRPEASVRPGLHSFPDYDVVWWDPQVLDFTTEANFGLRQEELLSEDEGATVADEGQELYRRWRESRAQVLERGARPRLQVRAVTARDEGPPGFVPPVDVDVLPKSLDRPSGLRFGTLVHTLLRDVPLDAAPEVVRQVAGMHARLVDSTPEEVEAAVGAVVNALRHPVLQRAREAFERGECRRETPFLLPLDDGEVLEGTVDLAFLEGDTWTVVDFKTDADLGPRRSHYERQLAWYVLAMERLTRHSARGFLLGI